MYTVPCLYVVCEGGGVGDICTLYVVCVGCGVGDICTLYVVFVGCGVGDNITIKITILCLSIHLFSEQSLSANYN